MRNELCVHIAKSQYDCSDMRAQPFKQSSRSTENKPVNNSFIIEALAKHAASRPAKTPPKAMPVTPVLPRMPKPRKRRPHS